jgi:hypothetical protein
MKPRETVAHRTRSQIFKAALNYRGADLGDGGVGAKHCYRHDIDWPESAPTEDERRDGNALTRRISQDVKERLVANAGIAVEEVAAPRRMPFVQCKWRIVASNVAQVFIIRVQRLDSLDGSYSFDRNVRNELGI